MNYVITIERNHNGFEIYGDDCNGQFTKELFIGYSKKSAIAKYRVAHGLKGKHIRIFDMTEEE